MTFDEIANYCMLKPNAEETYPFDEVTMVMKIGGKMFALLDCQTMETINLKHDSELIPELIANHASISPGYHMSKKHWITLNFNHTEMSDTEIIRLIDRSYDLVKSSLTKKVKARLDMTYSTFSIESPYYQQALQLRQDILRTPLNMKLSMQDIEGEEHDIHIGGIYEDKVLAYCIISSLDTHMCKIRQVCVSTSMQGVGIGMKLMEYAEEVAINHGCTSVILHARKTVMSWYESLNYEIIGDEFMEVGIPHYKMIKNL